MSTRLAGARVRPGRATGVLGLSALLLLASGCATAPGPRGAAGGYHQRAAVAEESAREPQPRLEPLENSSPRPRVRSLRYRHPVFRRAMSLTPVPKREWDKPEHEPPTSPACAPVPEGWPEQASGDEALLAPFLACASVSDFLALQRTVDMAPLVRRLGDWSAVRLGALGPLVEAHASRELTAKRASFLLKASRDYGASAQVFALFIVHTAFDDELDSLLRHLAHDKQLNQTLGSMEAVRQELARRGLKLEDYPERGEQARDVLRGLGLAAADALNSSPLSDGARSMNMSAQLQQLPPAYQRAQQELQQALLREHYAPQNVALGGLDQLSFGVPLGFYHLGMGTAHGLGELGRGHFEQATRELAPAALLVGLYVGGKGARSLAQRTGAGGRLGLPELRLEALQHVAWQVTERLGLQGLEELARHIRSSRQAAVFVAAGGEPAAVALYEARGNVARAQAWLSKAQPERAGAPEPKAPPRAASGGLASLVDEAAGYSAQVVEAKLHLAELEAPGPRLPADVALLRNLEATLSTPPPGVPEGYALWNEYVSYRQRRLAELEQGKSLEGPLRWGAYEHMRGLFARGLAFERAMVKLLRADAALPPARRQWLQGFQQPRIEVHVGVAKPDVPGIRFADVLVIELQPPTLQLPRVETFSFKSRYLALLEGKHLRAQIQADAQAALDYYGGTVDILRRSLKQGAEVQRVRLVYQGGILLPKELNRLEATVNAVARDVPGVEVLFQ